ncbi:MAG TPA: GIY-YIG nuclease family protein [Terriglobia bacterium]|nr:GIY-YIG nuclease family protein [Terriglobia bacterium]
MRFNEKRFVYIMRSDVDPTRLYTGLTADVVARLAWHNHGPRGFSCDYRPWSLVVFLQFATERDAPFRDVFEDGFRARVQ